MLQARQLTKTYGDYPALQRLDLEVKGGEIYCLLGANGAGKTTTINLFMGFTAPTAGEVLVDGRRVVYSNQATNELLAYIPENLNLYGNLTGRENLQYFAGLSKKRLNGTEADELLRSVGLQAAATSQRIRYYSKGMRQKVGIAIARAKGAGNLLLDEPTSGLDPQASNDFARLLEESRQNGVAVLMATHDLFRAKESGTHIGIMRAGRLVHSLASREITLGELEQLYLATMQMDVHV